MVMGNQSPVPLYEMWRVGICLLVIATTFASCMRPSETTSVDETTNNRREFRLKNETILIGEAEMEAIREVVVVWLAKEKDDTIRSLKAELQGSIAVIGPNDSRLGPWVLTDREGQLALVRIPPRSAVNYLFVAMLAREEGHWVVVEFFQERMIAR